MASKHFEEYYGGFRKHPLAVVSGFDGLPILETSRFYMLYKRNHNYGHMGGPKVIHIESKDRDNHEYVNSYFATSMCTSKAGCMQIGGMYYHFKQGDNLLIALPDEQQKLYRHIWNSIPSQYSCQYCWELDRQGFPEIWKLL